MVLFAVGIIVASVAGNVGTGLGGQDSLINQIATAVVMIVSIVGPYAMIPFALKFSSGVLGKIGGIANDKSKGLIDRSKNAYSNSGHKLRKQGAKDAKQNVRKQQATAEGVDRSLRRRGVRGMMYRKGLDENQQARLAASAENSLVGSAVEGHQRRGTPKQELLRIASDKKASAAERKAAALTLAKNGDGESLVKLQQQLLDSGDKKGAAVYDQVVRENFGDFKDAGAATTVSILNSSGEVKDRATFETDQVNKYEGMTDMDLAKLSTAQWKAMAQASHTDAHRLHQRVVTAAQAAAATGDHTLQREFKFNDAEANRVDPATGNPVHDDWWQNPQPRGGTASDLRLKRSVAFLGEAGGHRLYRFQYLWSDVEYVGVMAQDILQTHRSAVSKNKAGYYLVDYSQLGVDMETYESWCQRNGR